MRALLLILLISFCLPCFAQTKTISGEKIELNSSILNEHFKAWEVYHIPSTELLNRTTNPVGDFQIQLKLDNRHLWDLLLYPSDQRSQSYQIQLATGEFFPKKENKAFAGYELSTLGKSVRLTIDKNFIYGYIENEENLSFILS